MKRILLVEDDVTLSNGICLAMRNTEYEVVQCFTLKDAKKQEISAVDLIILDINLPDGNGLHFLKELRKNDDTNVIILTANDMETDIVAGLELGADDYITKPFSLAVLQARINARLRKSGEKERERECYENERFRFDFTEMKFYVDETLTEFSKTEQRLLRLLASNEGITLERGLLIEKIWDDEDSVEENALSVVIKRLRDKLEKNPAKPEWIRTVYGIGYVWGKCEESL